MAGATIDHMISLTILIAALLLAMTSFNQMFSTAIAYETNTQVATKAVDIMNTVCLSPGDPVDWGTTSDSVLGFGLQDPETGGYTLSPFSVMRLRTSNDNQLIEYPLMPGLFFNNLSGNFGHGIFASVGDCVNYTDTAELLGVTGKYDFSIDITPTLDVSISQVSQNPLKLNVEVQGSGLPLSDATLNYFLLYIDNTGTFPLIIPYSGVANTNSSGSVELDFSELYSKNPGYWNNPAYSFTVHVNIGGLTGVGYYTHNTIDGDSQYIIPLIQDFDDGQVIIAHNWDGDTPEVKYFATFFILTSDFNLQQVQIVNSTEHLNYGAGSPYFITKIPSSEAGLLVISYRKSGVEMGSVILPWGFSSLGMSASFGSNIGSADSDFVATELRQVTIDGISYQVKVSAWKLGN